MPNESNPGRSPGGPWVRHYVHFRSTSLGVVIDRHFGTAGFVLWSEFIAACKLNRPEGMWTFANEHQALAALGLSATPMVNNDGVAFTLDEFFRLLGRHHVVRRVGGAGTRRRYRCTTWDVYQCRQGSDARQSSAGEPWVKHYVNFRGTDLGVAIDAHFGAAGFVLWAEIIGACKLSRPEGTWAYSNERQALAALSMSTTPLVNNDGVAFSLNNFLHLLEGHGIVRRMGVVGSLERFECATWDVFQSRRGSDGRRSRAA